MKDIKRRAVLAVMLSLILIGSTTGVLSGSSYTQHMFVNEGRQGLLQNCRLFIVDHSLYIKTQEGFYLWHPDLSSPQNIGRHLWDGGSDPRHVFVFSQEDMAFAFELDTSTIYQVKRIDERLAPAESWPFPTADANGMALPVFDVHGAAMAGNQFWLFIFAVDTHEYELWHFAPGDSALIRQSTPNLRGISGYDQTQFLAVQKSAEGPPVLLIWDSLSNERTQAAFLDEAPLFAALHPVEYSKKGEEIFYIGDRAICSFAMDSDDIKEYGVLGSPYDLALLDNRYLASISEAGLTIHDTKTPQAERTVLRVAGSMPDDILNYAASMMPDTQIQVISGWNARKTMEALVSRDPYIDLYVLDTEEDMIDSILSKGYLLPFSPDSESFRFVEGAYPSVRQCVMKEDKAYLLPLSLRSHVFAFVQDVFQEMNLRDPLNFNLYIEALHAWMGGLNEEYPEYSFGHRESLREELYSLAFDLYRHTQRSRGEELAFDSPLFREMMNRLDQLSASELSSLGSLSDEERSIYEGFSILPITDSYWNYAPEQEHEYQSMGNQWKPVILSANEHTPSAARADMSLLGISAFSKNADAAFRFADHCRGALSESFSAMLLPDKSEAIENPQYDIEVGRYTSVIQALELDIALTRERGGNPSGLEQDLFYFQSLLARSEQTIKYILTCAELECVHQKMDSLYVPNDIHRAEDQSGLQNLFDQYVFGVLSLDQFISQADSTLRLIRHEFR